MDYRKNLFYIIIFLVFCCNIFAQYQSPTYGYPGSQPYDKPPQVNVVRTQTLTTYNAPNTGYSHGNYGPSPRENYNSHYSRYYQNRGFSYGQYGPNRYGSHSYLPYRGYPMVDSKDRAVMGLGLLASSLIGKKHA